MLQFLCIFMGGGIGAMLRYLSDRFVSSVFNAGFPLGTLFVNCVGALLIGFLINFFGPQNPNAANMRLRPLLITGFLGGYTTFSAYSLETARYLMVGNIKQALLNVLLNNALCIALVFAGMRLNKVIMEQSVH
jgi:fluoride exporter